MTRLPTRRAEHWGAPLLFAVVGFVALPACAEPDYRPADLQLDIGAPLPAGAERIHVCVDGVGMLDQGAGNGRVAFAAIPPDGSYAITVEVQDADGASLGVAGPVTLGTGATYAVAPFDTAAGGGCRANGQGVHEGDESWLLGIRFDESETPWDVD